MFLPSVLACLLLCLTANSVPATLRHKGTQMRIKLTFRFDTDELRAIAMSFTHKRPANRTQTVQWLSALVATELAALRTKIQQQKEADDRFQLKLFEDNKHHNEVLACPVSSCHQHA